MTLTVTLDTNTIDHRARIEAACAGLDVELAYTTVTNRETEGTSRATGGATVAETAVWNESRWGEAVWGSTVPETGVYGESKYDSGAIYAKESVPETIVFGESQFGAAVFGGPTTQSILELILKVIGSGSFPPPGRRDQMTPVQRSQLRDAMVLEAHQRDGRDVLVTDDGKAFINHGRREFFETAFTTRIMRVDEFCENVADLAK
jgi:hypothetical protein